MWDEPNVEARCRISRSFQIPKRVLVHIDSRTVVTEVEIR